MLAKTVELKDKVEVIVKKVIVNERYGIVLNFIAELEDDSMISTSITTEYDKKKVRDEDFTGFTYHNLAQIGMTLETFKELLK